MPKNNHIATWEESYDTENDISESQKLFFATLEQLIREWQNNNQTLEEISRLIMKLAMLNLMGEYKQRIYWILRNQRNRI